MVYGYSRRVINEYGLMEMREVTFALAPEELRVVGQFLLDMAQEMEGRTFEKTTHRHLSTSHPGWTKSTSNADVIVMPPVAASE